MLPAMPLAALVPRALILAAAAGLLSGCLATTAVGAAAGVAGAAVGVTAKAASTTVHVGHVAVDAATGSGGAEREDVPEGR